MGLFKIQQCLMAITIFHYKNGLAQLFKYGMKHSNNLHHGCVCYRESGELVFMDASGSMDYHDCRVFLMLTHSRGGGVPLGEEYLI